MRTLIWLVILLFCSLAPFISIGQMTYEARKMADSIANTRVLCEGTTLALEEEIFFPATDIQKSGSYYFEYTIQIRSDLSCKLAISLGDDYTVQYVRGMKDSSYNYNVCDIIPRWKLWKTAKFHGLRGGYKKSKYNLYFASDGIYIYFRQKSPCCDIDTFRINAITGEFIQHSRMNVSF